MNDNDKRADMNTDIAANDLTQLSSREQLSALMDSALPADQTRFLLRRLQHDAPLAECWERWRVTGEVMRGLAPARRMPQDFASRVSAALHGDATVAPATRNARAPAWLRWGGGAAMAASLAVVALVARQQGVPADAAQPAQVAAATTQRIAMPAPLPTQQAPAIEGARLVTAATAAAIASPQRKAQRDASRASARLQSAARREPALAETAQVAALQPGVHAPQPDIVTRPWPRSVLPQYASGGLTVGFGEHMRGNVPYNPFQQAGIADLPPIAKPVAGANGDTADAAQNSAADPQREAQAQP